MPPCKDAVGSPNLRTLEHQVVAIPSIEKIEKKLKVAMADIQGKVG